MTTNEPTVLALDALIKAAIDAVLATTSRPSPDAVFVMVPVSSMRKIEGALTALGVDMAAHRKLAKVLKAQAKSA